MKDSEKEQQLAEHDLDAASEASSEPDYNYEFAQMEVIMKTLNSNGKKLVLSITENVRQEHINFKVLAIDSFFNLFPYPDGCK